MAVEHNGLIVNWLRVLGTAELPHIDRGVRHQFHAKIVVVKYVGDTFLDLSYEKQPGHPDKKGRPVPPEGLQRKCLSAGRVASVAV
jgi:hypothetical protein